MTQGSRHQIRDPYHDYNGGIYFVTISSYKAAPIFGKIYAAKMSMSKLGSLVDNCIRAIPDHHKSVEVWNHVVMPNHVHIVLFIDKIDQDCLSQNSGCLKHAEHSDECPDFHHNSRLSSIIGSFKATVTRLARTRNIASQPCWQPRFYEHIIRTPKALDLVMNYIDNNVYNWPKDCYYNQESNDNYIPPE